MKKEELLDIITPLVGRTNLSDKTLSDFSENMAPFVSDGTKPDDAMIKGYVNMLKSMSGNLSHGIAEGIDEWKKKNPLPKPDEPKPAPALAPKPGMSDEMKQILDKMASIEKQNKELSERFAKEETAKATESYWSSLKGEVSKKVKVNDYLAKLAFEGMKPDMEQPIDANVVDGFIKAYDTVCEKAGVEKASPANTVQYGGGSGDNYFKDYMKHKCPDDFKQNKE